MSDGRNIFDGDNFRGSSERDDQNYQNNQNDQGYYGNNNDYNNQYNNQYSYQNSMSDLSKPKNKALSIASLVTGILAVICCCLGWTGIILGAVAVGTAIASRVKLGYFDGMAIAGLVLGIFGFVSGLVLVVASYALGDEFWAEFEKAFWEEYNKQYPNGGSGV